MVTVIIPTRDRWPLLSVALRSALAQRDVDVEVIVIDDGSRDETPERLAEIADPRLTVLRNESSVGVSRARNLGIEIATGSWIAFLDDDDVWAPHKLRVQLDLATREDASFVYSATVLMDELHGLQRVLVHPTSEDLSTELLWGNVVFVPSTVVARTELVRETGGFDSSLSTVADWDLWIRLAARGKAAVCREPLAGYRLHAENMHGTVDPEQLRREYERLTAKYGVDHRESLTCAYAHVHRRKGRRVAASRCYLRAARATRDPRHLARAAGVLLGERAMATRGWTRSRRPLGLDWLQ